MDPPDYDAKSVSKILKPEGVRAALEKARDNLSRAEFTETGIQQAIRQAETAAGLAEGRLNQPVRVAATGTAVGAGIYETLAGLGKERALARLEFAIERLCA